MSIRNVLNNLDLVISKKGQILRRPDIGSIIVKDSGICTHNHIPFTLENLSPTLDREHSLENQT